MPRTAPPDEVLRVALAALDRGERVVVATVIARHGSAPSTPGQKLALAGGHAVGTVGGGAIEHAILAQMLELAEGPPVAPRIATFRLGPSLGMCCGGSADVLLEPLQPALSVLVVGAGHVGHTTAARLAELGFRVRVCDGRESAAGPERVAELSIGVPIVHADHDDPESLEGLGDPTKAALLVSTHDHQLDQAAIEWGLARGFAYVGGVGSRAKAARTRARLETKGFSAADLDRVRMPVGLDIGARTPAEIAIAIAGELIAWRAELQRNAVRSAPAVSVAR